MANYGVFYNRFKLQFMLMIIFSSHKIKTEFLFERYFSFMIKKK